MTMDYLVPSATLEIAMQLFGFWNQACLKLIDMVLNSRQANTILN